jgi:hypothetical protein
MSRSTASRRRWMFRGPKWRRCRRQRIRPPMATAAERMAAPRTHNDRANNLAYRRGLVGRIGNIISRNHSSRDRERWSITGQERDVAEGQTCIGQQPILAQRLNLPAHIIIPFECRHPSDLGGARGAPKTGGRAGQSDVHITTLRGQSPVSSSEASDATLRAVHLPGPPSVRTGKLAYAESTPPVMEDSPKRTHGPQAGTKRSPAAIEHEWARCRSLAR